MSKAPEEELIRLLKFSTARKIRDFLKKNPMMDLHYPSKNLSSPLTSAIDRSDPATLAMLIDKIPGDLDATLTQPCGKTALMHASYNTKNPEVLHVLIKKGADPSKRDMYGSIHPKFALIYIQNFIHPLPSFYQNGWNCLFYAVIGKRLQNVIALLDCEVSIESKDCQGRTPLMISVYLSSLEVFDLLIERKANVNALDSSGMSAMQLAILRKKRDCVLQLNRLISRLDNPAPFSNVSTQRLLEELMSDVLPVKRS